MVLPKNLTNLSYLAKATLWCRRGFRMTKCTVYRLDSYITVPYINITFNAFLQHSNIIWYHVKDSCSFGVSWVTTFGPGYGEVTEFVAKANETLKRSPLFTELESPVLGVVTKRSPNLRDQLFNQKSICLDIMSHPLGSVTTRCTVLGTKAVGRPCEACKLMSGESRLRPNYTAITGSDR